MKLSKGKIILIVVVLYFVIFAIINVNKEKNINEKILDEVIFVTDGKVKTENEGKIVLVSGDIKYDSLVSFLELDENLKTIKISRKVEDYKKVDGSLKWVERTESNEGESEYVKQIISSEKVSNISLGEYNLDSKGLSLIKADSYYSGQEEVLGFTTTGIDYTRDPWEEDLKEGDIKLTYKYYDLQKYPSISVLAVQKGNSFEPYKADKKTEIYQIFTKKINNKEELKKELNLNVKRTIKGKSLFIIMILAIGIFFIVDNKKKN